MDRLGAAAGRLLPDARRQGLPARARSRRSTSTHRPLPGEDAAQLTPVRPGRRRRGRLHGRATRDRARSPASPASRHAPIPDAGCGVGGGRLHAVTVAGRRRRRRPGRPGAGWPCSSAAAPRRSPPSTSSPAASPASRWSWCSARRSPSAPSSASAEQLLDARREVGAILVADELTTELLQQALRAGRQGRAAAHRSTPTQLADAVAAGRRQPRRRAAARRRRRPTRRAGADATASSAGSSRCSRPRAAPASRSSPPTWPSSWPSAASKPVVPRRRRPAVRRHRRDAQAARRSTRSSTPSASLDRLDAALPAEPARRARAVRACSCCPHRSSRRSPTRSARPRWCAIVEMLRTFCSLRGRRHAGVLQRRGARPDRDQSTTCCWSPAWTSRTSRT